MKVLIVDDNRLTLRLLELWLSKDGYEVVTAENGRHALDHLRAEKIDLIISDILMPEMDGFQLCRAVKTHPSWKDIVFVFYTATYIEAPDEELAKKVGADIYMHKPQDQVVFLENIHKLFEKLPLKPTDIALLDDKEEKEVLKLYSDRLVKKLEKKTLALREEMAQNQRTVERLKASLREKEMQLKEVHHRVKNNMAVIASLISLQSRKINDEQVRKSFLECGHKIRAMSLVHELLHESGTSSVVDFHLYLTKLAQTLFVAYEAAGRNITVTIQATGLKIDVNQAAPCGLVVNELITNSLKHAFPDNRPGQITINVGADSMGGYRLVVGDNGVGLPSNLSWRQTTTLGLRLVVGLVEQQLNGNIDIEKTEGTRFIITFGYPYI